MRNDIVLVTGSSGFIGTHLVSRLVEMGKSVSCIDIKEPRVRLPGVRYIEGDVRNISALDISGTGAIINLAAVHTTPGHPDHEYYDTNVLGALEIVKAAELHGVKNIIFTSSISVYGPSEDRKTEESKPAPVTAYGKSKFMAEEIFRLWCSAREDRKLIIARPAVVFGPGEGGNFTRMAKLMSSGFFVFPGRRDAIKSCIYVQDLIDIMMHAYSAGGNYELINGSYLECPTLEDIVTALRDGYFPNARFVDVPAGIVKGAAKMLSMVNGLGLGIHPERVEKLLRSTNVYPAWAEKNRLLMDRTLQSGLEAWARASNGAFT